MDLTEPELTVLKEFASFHGSMWRRRLRTAWRSGLYCGVMDPEDMELLEGLRDKIGMDGLLSFTFPGEREFRSAVRALKPFSRQRLGAAMQEEIFPVDALYVLKPDFVYVDHERESVRSFLLKHGRYYASLITP